MSGAADAASVVARAAGAASAGVLGGRIAAWLLALPLVAVLAALALSWQQPQTEIWAHLRAHVLWPAVGNTLALLAAVAALASLLGVGLGWLSARCDYPGRRWLDWALVLPLAMPTYVVAFAWVGLLDYAGPLQSSWRALGGSRAALFDGRGLAGAALLLSLVLYPYVYVLARAAFLRQGAAAFDAARSLGSGPWSAFFHVALPLVRPAWIAGLALALLETLADFGAVSILGVSTLTTAIYRTWFGQYSLPAAAQLACLLLLGVVAVLALERALRGRARRHEPSLRAQPRVRLSGWRGGLASAAAFAVFALGFLLPALQLLAWLDPQSLDGAMLWRSAANTLAVAAPVAIAVVVGGAVLAGLAQRRPADHWTLAAGFVGTLGYAVPGTVLAVAAMGLMIAVDGWAVARFGIELALAGSIVGLLFALGLRFLRVGHDSIEAGLAQLRPSLVDSAKVLGAGRWRILGRVVLPQLRPSLLAAVLLVAVEAMKELPATLMLRPFGWDTLAVRTYGFTAEGLWAQAAAPALLLVLVGLAPVWWLLRAQR